MLHPADDSHRPCVEVLKSIVEPLGTTVPVLTEAFNLLSPGSVGAQTLFISSLTVALRRGFSIRTRWIALSAFGLMQQYTDPPMDLADASLVAMAEAENLKSVTLRQIQEQAKP